MALLETTQGVHFDELIGGTAVPVITKNVTIAAADSETTYKKGTLLAVNEDKYSPCESGGTATAILTHDISVSTDETTATVYVSGMFNREKLITSEGDTIDAHEEELRAVGILLTSIQGIAEETDEEDGDQGE